MDPSPPILLTPAQVARQLGVTPGRVRQLFAADALPFIPTPLGRLVEPEALARFIECRAKAGSGTRGAKAVQYAR